MSKKKLVLIGPAYPYRGGNALYVSHVYEVLQDKYDIVLINFSLFYPSIIFPGKTQRDESNTLTIKVPNRRLINSINPISWVKTANEIKKINPDLVVFDWWQPFFGPCYNAISSLLKKHFKLLFITENIISHEARFVDRLFTSWGIKHADAFLCLSGTVEQGLQPIKKDRKVYKSALPVYDFYKQDEPVNVKQQRQELGLSVDSKVILFFGYIRKYKGLDILINAMPAILEKEPNARLLIVGESYDPIEKYKEQINNLGLNDKVVLVERFVANEEVGNYYSIADVVVLPYRNGTQSGVLNIAYAFNKPVIVSNVGGLAEDVVGGKTGFVVEPENPQAIAQAFAEFQTVSEQENFEENITQKVKDHPFFKMPELMGQIMNDLNNG